MQDNDLIGNLEGAFGCTSQVKVIWTYGKFTPSFRFCFNSIFLGLFSHLAGRLMLIGKLSHCCCCYVLQYVFM